MKWINQDSDWVKSDMDPREAQKALLESLMRVGV